MLYELDGERLAEMRQALMDCVVWVGGEFVAVDRLGFQTGHLDGHEISPFCEELVLYMEDCEMTGENRQILSEIVGQLAGGQHRTILVVEQGSKTDLAARPEAHAFDDTIETRDEVSKGLSKLEELLRNLDQDQATQV